MKYIFYVLLVSFVSVLYAENSLELIPQEKLGKARELMFKEGITLSSDQLVGMCFDPSVKEHTSLIVITIDQNLNPVKNVYTVSPAYFLSLNNDSSAMVLSQKKETPAPLKEIIKTTEDTSINLQEGRTYFIVSTALRTWTIYPAGYSTLLGDNSDWRTVTGLSLLTFGGSLYGSYRFTKNSELGYGRVAMMNYGGELAITYSGLLSRFIYGAAKFEPEKIGTFTYEIYDTIGPTGRDTTVLDTIESAIPGKILAAGSIFGFPLGIYLGSISNLSGNYQYGNADIMRFFGRSAWLYGYLLPMYGSGGDKYNYALASSGLTLGLIPTGIYLGHRLVKGHDYSSGRGFLIETTGIMGGLTGLLVPTLFNVDFDSVTSRRILVTSILAGHALGTTFGFKYKEQNSYTFSQGVFTAFSAACGGAVGLSIPFLAQADSSNPYIIAGLLGAWGGFVAGEYLSHSIFEKTGHDKNKTANISFPIFSEWPIMLAYKFTAGEKDFSLPVADVVRWNF